MARPIDLLQFVYIWKLICCGENSKLFYILLQRLCKIQDFLLDFALLVEIVASKMTENEQNISLFYLSIDPTWLFSSGTVLRETAKRDQNVDFAVKKSLISQKNSQVGTPNNIKSPAHDPCPPIRTETEPLWWPVLLEKLMNEKMKMPLTYNVKCPRDLHQKNLYTLALR